MITVTNAKDQDIPTLVKVRIHDGNQWVEFGNYGDHERVFGLELSNNIDNPAWSCDRLEFRNNPSLGPSLDPNDPNSDFNDGTIADTLLSPKHKLEVLLSKDYGDTWITKFRGAVGKPLGTRKVDRDDLISISPLDNAQPLKDVPIEGVDPEKQQPYEFNEMWIEDLIDAILDIKTYGKAPQISLDRDNSDIPDFLIKEMKVKGITYWKAISNVAEKVGHKIMFRNYDGTDGPVLVLFDPQRGKVGGRLKSTDEGWEPDDTLKGGFDIRETETDQMDVRTAARVHYKDKDVGPHSVFVEDEEALDKYGARDYDGGKMHRTMVLKEEDKSHIDTQVEARNYGHYCLDDVNAPESKVDYGFRYCNPAIQLYDILRIEGMPDYDYDVELGVTSISLSVGYERQQGDTQIHGTINRVRGSKSYWLEMGHLPDTIDEYRGDQRPPPAPKNPPGLTKKNFVDDTGNEKCKVICEGEYVDAPDIVAYRWRYREIIDGDREDWQYASETGDPTSVIPSLDVGKDIELEVQYKAKDFETSYPSGVEGDGEWSPIGIISLYPDTMPPATPTLDEANGNPGNVEFFWTNPTTNKDGSDLKDFGRAVVYLKAEADPTKDDYDIKSGVGKTDKFNYNSGVVGTTYHVGIVAEDQVGNESDMSNIMSAEFKSPGADPDTSTFDDTFKDVQVGDGMIGFQFNTPDNWQGFDHWELQRSKDGGDYETVWEGRGVAHIDKNLDTGSSYEYTLYGVAEDGTKSSGSTTGPHTPDNSDNSNLLGNIFMADVIVGVREVRSQHVEVGSLSAIQALTGNIKTGDSGARFEIFPDSDTGIKLIDDEGNPVLEGIIGGTDVGDVIMGDPTGQHAKWDKSEGEFQVTGAVKIDGNLGGSDIFNTLEISGNIEGNYSAGSSGWRIEGDGSAEFNSGKFRGTLYASDITLTDDLGTLNDNMGTLKAGKISVAGGDVEIGESVIGTGDGIYVKGGHIYVEEESGREIFNTSVGFNVIPVAGSMSRDGGSGNISTGTTSTIHTFTKPIVGGVVAIAKDDDADSSEEDSWCTLRDDSGKQYLYQEEAGTPGSTRLKAAPWAWDALIYPLPNWLPQGTGEIRLRNGDDVDRNYHYWVIYAT